MEIEFIVNALITLSIRAQSKGEKVGLFLEPPDESQDKYDWSASIRSVSKKDNKVVCVTDPLKGEPIEVAEHIPRQALGDLNDLLQRFY